MDPFDIGSPVGTIQAYTCMDEKVRVFKDKWSGLNQKTKELWDQTDDNDKLVILGCTKSSNPSPFPSRPPSKPPFPPKQHCGMSQVDETNPEPSDTLLVNAAKGSRPLPPGDIRGIYNHQLYQYRHRYSWRSYPNTERTHHRYNASICIAQEKTQHPLSLSIRMVQE
jgi:hypothetical protein